MHPVFAESFGFVMQSTNVGINKIDSPILEIYKIVIAVFLVSDQTERVKLFKETFLVANVNPNMVLGIPFFALSGANVDFQKKSFGENLLSFKKPFLSLNMSNK